MDEKKLKLIEYLVKNLGAEENKLSEIEKLDEDIMEKEIELGVLKEKRTALGDKEVAIANVDEIKGYIEMFNEPEKVEKEPVVDSVVEAEVEQVAEVSTPVVG